MASVGLQKDIWVLVCDGRKALLLHNAGDRVYPKLETKESFEHSEQRTSEMGSAGPGRVFGSGGVRSSTEETDMHTLAEQAFLKHVAQHLDREVAAKHIHKLILVAPARALGMIRKELSHAVQGVIAAEVDKDYVKFPVYEIESHLAKALE